jgi:hypothetical protein
MAAASVGAQTKARQHRPPIVPAAGDPMTMRV